MKISDSELQKVQNLLKEYTDRNGTIGEKITVSTNCKGSCWSTCRGSCSGKCKGLCSGTCKGTCQSACKGGCRGTCKGSCSGTARKFYN